MSGGLNLSNIALLGLALTVALASLTWVASLVQRDASLVDRMWSILIGGAAALYAWLLPMHAARGPWMLGLVVVWAVRLSVYITARNWGHGEDRRYQAIRARNEPNFARKSLYRIFGIQAVLAWIVSTPFLVGMATPSPLSVLDYVGIIIAGFGIVFEAVGDAQLSYFKRDPGNAGQVMDRGLWRYTRHPNYFGETCVWWGVWLIAVSGGGLAAAWSVIAPLQMTFLLLKVSGVTLLEKDINERRPAYRDYIARTNAFFPGFPRRKDGA